MITFHDILRIYDINPDSTRLVRHGNKEIQVRETFQNNILKFESYQSFQKPKKFGKFSSIAVFAPYYKTTAIFLGLWDINGCIHCKEFTEQIKDELSEHELPEEWFTNSDRYILERNDCTDDLSERLVIEWGASQFPGFR